MFATVSLSLQDAIKSVALESDIDIGLDVGYCEDSSGTSVIIKRGVFIIDHFCGVLVWQLLSLQSNVEWYRNVISSLLSWDESGLDS